jgi:hypothetical protein
MSKSFRIAAAIGILGMLIGIAVGAYAFTDTVSFNANSLPLSIAYGQTPAESYTVSGVHFTPSGADNSRWTQLSFNLDNAISSGATIQVTYGGSGTTLTGSNSQASGVPGTCSVSGAGPYVWTCTPSGSSATFVSVTQLAVLISQ